MMNCPNRHATVAGTFDHLHKGHRKLIQTAFKLAPQISLGIANPSFIQHKDFPQAMEPFVKRRQAIDNYLRRRRVLARTRIFTLKDVCGIACQDETLDAIVVSGETLARALIINDARSAKKLASLRIVKIPFVRGDDGEIISSTRIRAGEIDREGRSYLKIFDDGSIRCVSQSLKSRLRRPLGFLIQGRDDMLAKTARQAMRFIKSLKPVMVITVGDVVSATLTEVDFEPDLTITDGKVRRRRIADYVNLKKRPASRAENQPGTINSQAVKRCRELLFNFFKHKKCQRLFIEGEEDLMALPAILLAPLGGVVVYGQYDCGIVAVAVSEEKKSQIKRLVSQFSNSPCISSVTTLKSNYE